MNEKEKLKLLGRNIAKCRKEAGYSQNKFVELIGISGEHLAKVETAKRGTSLNLLFKIADVSNISEKAFFDFE